MSLRSSGVRYAVILALFLCVPIFGRARAGAAETPHPGVAVDIGLHRGSGRGAGISLGLELTPAEANDAATRAPIRTLRMSGPIGSLDLRGVPICKPTTRSVRTSGCTTPTVGRASGVAVEIGSSESGIALKHSGTFRLYSGGQQGKVSKLYLWASFPGVGRHSGGRSQVITLVYTKKSGRDGELVASFSRPEEDALDIALLRMSIDRSVDVGGHSIRLTEVGCPLPSTAGAAAVVSFWGPRDPVDATPSLICRG
jgi:hypothetical protein